MNVNRLLKVIAAFGLLALGSSVGRSSEESTWDAYVERTLAAVIKQHESDASKTDRYFTSDNFPSRAKVVFLGKQRSVPKERSSFLDQYFKSVKQPEFRKLFKSEVLVKEGDQEHWLPVQTELLPAILEEVKPEAEFEVFVTWLGAVRVSGKLEWIFTINEFQVAEEH
jgi:hypothetical protein